MRESSHIYTFAPIALARITGRRLLALPVLALLALLVHVAGPWPHHRSPVSMDEAVIAAKAELASRPTGDPALVCIGDSTCLMNVDTRMLDGLNLGTLSYLTFDAYTQLLRAYLQANPAPAAVVLVLHPATLRRARSDDHHLQTLNSRLTRDRRKFDVSAWRGWVDAHVRPRPVPHRFVSAYGHTMGVRRGLLTARGNLDGEDVVDEALVFGGRPDYPLSSDLEASAREFRALLPNGTELILVLSPTPMSQALPSTPQRYAELTQELIAWLDPARHIDVDAVWPDEYFVDGQHVTRAGREIMTRRIYEYLFFSPSAFAVEAPSGIPSDC